jgi:hypothetical protein
VIARVKIHMTRKYAEAIEVTTQCGLPKKKQRNHGTREMTYATARLQKQFAGKNLNTLGKSTYSDV